MTRGINSSCIRLYYLGGKCHIYVGLINLFSTNKTIHNATTLSSRKWRFWLSNFCHYSPLILYFHTSSLRNLPDDAHFSKVFATFPFIAFCLLMSVFRHFNTIWIALTKERLWFSEICCCAANCENVWTADHFICKFSALPWLAADRGGRGLIVKYFQVISTHWPKFCPFSFCCSWLANILRVFKLYWGEKAENKVLIKMYSFIT